METARHFVGVVIKLTARVEHRKDNFCGGRALFVHVRGDSPAIILHRHGFIGVNGDFYALTKAGQCFIDGVIHDLKDHVMQARAIVRIADVHTGALTHRIQPLEDFNL